MACRSRQARPTGQQEPIGPQRRGQGRGTAMSLLYGEMEKGLQHGKPLIQHGGGPAADRDFVRAGPAAEAVRWPAQDAHRLAPTSTAI
jgi:hypothetical protein